MNGSKDFEWTEALKLAKQIIEYLENDDSPQAEEVRSQAYKVQQLEEMKLWNI